MSTIHRAALAALFTATLAACGGGGDSGLPASLAPSPAPAPAPAPSSNPTPGAAPTAALVDSSTTANAMADEADGAIEAASARSLVPGAINLQSVPAGAIITNNCTGGGSYTYDYPATIGAGTSYSFTYNNCSFGGGYYFNGSYVITYNSFAANGSSFSWTATYNLNYTGPNNFSYTYNGSQRCDYASGAYSCTYSASGRTFESSFTYSGGVINGNYQWTYGSFGTVRYVFTNWGATSGTIQVTGANGTSATIVRNSATSYTITINGGTPYTVTR